MIATQRQPLPDIFNDPSYAWELLEWQIAIEMDQDLNGQAIARLLQLYMRGVEKMNSLMDFRESYFKNKVTSLMMKNTVVKTLNKPPMAKKQKPLETSANNTSKTNNKSNGTVNGSKKSHKTGESSSKGHTVSPLVLKEKRKEIQMRLAYEAETTSRDNMNKIYDQHLKKQEKYQSKVKNIIQNHEQLLKERIMRRKLKTSTYRSRPEDTSDTFGLQQNMIKKQYQETFSPRQSKKIEEQGSQKKRCKSLQSKAKHDLNLDSPKRQRKYTQDFSDSGKKETEKRNKQIQNFKQFKRKVQQYKKSKEKDVIEMVIQEQNSEDNEEGQQSIMTQRQSI